MLPVAFLRLDRSAWPCRGTILAVAMAAAGVRALHAQSDEPAAPRMPSIPEIRVAPIRPSFIFFPPTPPVLDAAAPRLSVQVIEGRVRPAPEELAPYVGDVFYPQLGTRLIERGMTPKLEKRVADYRVTKQSLLEELRAVLAKLPPDDWGERRRTLSDFARRQTPRIVVLEAAAEKLRGDLKLPERDWSSYREWSLGDKKRRGFSPRETAQVIRAYAHFQKNIPPAHRYLLREIALELVNATDHAANVSAPRETFFSPAFARVVLPHDLPPDVAAQLADFQARKARLKKELFEAVNEQDGATFEFLNRSLRTTVDRQQKALAELEVLAEQIRPSLALLMAGAPAAIRSPVPLELAARVTTMLTAQQRVQGEARSRVAGLAARLRRTGGRVAYAFTRDKLDYTIEPDARPATADMQAHFEREAAAFSAAAEAYALAMADIAVTRDALRAETGGILGTTDLAQIDAALFTAMRAVANSESAAAFQDYRAAVFEPGMSPEQRRLLFEGAIVKLELLLPRGELQPVEMSDTW